MTIKPTMYSIEQQGATPQTYQDIPAPPLMSGSPHLNVPCVTSYSPEMNHVFKPSSYEVDNKKEQKQ
jgi:hypothetical protein